MRLRSASAFLFSASMRLRCVPPRPSSAPPRCACVPPRPSSSPPRCACVPPRPSFLRLDAFAFLLGLLPLRLGLVLLRLDTLAFRLGLVLLRLDALAFRLGLSASFLGALLLRFRRLRLLLDPAFLLRLLAALLLEQCELLLFFGPFRRQSRLLLLQGLDPSRLRFSLSRELREALRLLAFTLALRRGVLSLAFALHPFELEEPALLLGPTALRGLGFPFEVFDSFAFLLAEVLVLFAQALELLRNLTSRRSRRLRPVPPGDRSPREAACLPA